MLLLSVTFLPLSKSQMIIKYTLLLIAATLSILAGCTTTAPEPWDHPVILDRGGSPAAKAAVETCLAKAQDAGLTPMVDSQKNQAYRRAVQSCIREKGFVTIGWN
jgi:hypothetical protein